MKTILKAAADVAWKIASVQRYERRSVLPGQNDMKTVNRMRALSVVTGRGTNGQFLKKPRRYISHNEL
jgi:hypothetical protein